LPRHSFVVDQYVFPALHMAPNGRHYFIFGHIRRHHATRDLPFSVDPFDDPATATPRLLDGRGHTTAAQMK
jgi:hypothetical protein